MAHITHIQPGMEKRREWYRGFVEKKKVSSPKHVLTIVTSDSPAAARRELIHLAERVGGQDL